MSNVVDAEDILTADRVRALFDYDPLSGVLRYRPRVLSRGRITKRAGAVAGHRNQTLGYVEIRINKVLYLAHRLIWLHVTGVWPPDQIDHRDLDRSNNRWGNLRLATNGQNVANRRLSKRNRSGVKGVHMCRRSNRWIASITINRRYVHLGAFRKIEDAAAARQAAARRAFGEFARLS